MVLEHAGKQNREEEFWRGGEKKEEKNFQCKYAT